MPLLRLFVNFDCDVAHSRFGDEGELAEPATLRKERTDSCSGARQSPRTGKDVPQRKV